MAEDSRTCDAFVSYASEDRNAVAAPLASLLEHLGLRIWFDQTELKVGDSLRERIDDGLLMSRYGIVILSQAFFAKHWSVRELNGLAQREVDGQKVILPVWYGIDEKIVCSFSPFLADRIALPWTRGLYTVAMDLIAVMRPDILAELKARASKVVALTSIKTGQQVARIVEGSHMFQFFSEPTQDQKEADQVATFLQEAQDWGDIWEDIDAGGRVQAGFSMHESLITLLDSGWSVHGGRTKRKVKLKDQTLAFDVAVIAVVKGSPPGVFVDGDHAIIVRASTVAI